MRHRRLSLLICGILIATVTQGLATNENTDSTDATTVSDETSENAMETTEVATTAPKMFKCNSKSYSAASDEIDDLEMGTECVFVMAGKRDSPSKMECQSESTHVSIQSTMDTFANMSSGAKKAVGRNLGYIGDEMRTRLNEASAKMPIVGHFHKQNFFAMYYICREDNCNAPRKAMFRFKEYAANADALKYVDEGDDWDIQCAMNMKWKDLRYTTECTTSTSTTTTSTTTTSTTTSTTTTTTTAIVIPPNYKLLFLRLAVVFLFILVVAAALFAFYWKRELKKVLHERANMKEECIVANHADLMDECGALKVNMRDKKRQLRNLKADNDRILLRMFAMNMASQKGADDQDQEKSSKSTRSAASNLGASAMQQKTEKM